MRRRAHWTWALAGLLTLGMSACDTEEDAGGDPDQGAILDGSAGAGGEGGAAGMAGGGGEGGAAGVAGGGGEGGAAGVAGGGGEGGAAGMAGSGGEGGAPAECQAPADCLAQRWAIRCMGHWACEAGACVEVCDAEGCGDGQCEPARGESPLSCSVDCRAQCERDADCPPDTRCDPCARSSCPECDDCLSACVAHGCETEPQPACDAERPDCGQGAVAVVREGCWQCVGLNACQPIEPQCLGEGQSGAVVPDALACCDGLMAIGCDEPLADGMCPGGCDGGFVCARCGDGQCGPGENRCNCPMDCGGPAPECVAEGGNVPVVPNAPECCDGLAPVPCGAPGPDGQCEPCVGASVCVACGDGVCGAGENLCNCPADCGDDPGACVEEGGNVPVVPDAPQCCAGLAPIGCDRPDADGRCRGGCVGASVCARCGDGQCGPGENPCSCPMDCADTSPDCAALGGYCGHWMDECAPGFEQGEAFDCPLGRSGQCCAPARAFRYYLTCGDPVCRGHTPRDDVPPCEGQAVGDACDQPGALCDPIDGCNALVVCADEDPRANPCPISKAEFKQEIDYLGPAEVEAAAQAVRQIKLATWRYTHAPGARPSLGFIIDDAPHPAAVQPDGRHVDLYGYTSLTVAAVQAQAVQLERLQQQLERLERRLSACEQRR